MASSWVLVIVALLILEIFQQAESLTCCIGSFEVEKCPRDPRRTCKKVGCERHKCEVHGESDDSRFQAVSCSTWKDCPGVAPLCRLLYIQRTTDQSENNANDRELNEQTGYFVQQDCFDNSYEDVKVGCDFTSRIFYENHRERISYTKECFCKQNRCNNNLIEICISSGAVTRKETNNSKCDKPDKKYGGAVNNQAGGRLKYILIGICVLIYGM